MAQTGAFVPAWKRLGLKLKKSESDLNDQSAEQRIDHSSAQDGLALQEGDKSSQFTKATPKLGKRKHDAETADIEGDSVKKSKIDQENALPNGHAVASTETEPQPAKPAATEAAPADKPKGDPNYRKKKGGDPNYRKKKEPKQAQNGHKSASTLAPPKITRTPSLSPGQPDLAANGSTLLPSTETDFPAPASLATPKNRKAAAAKDSSWSLSPPKTDRRKSVTFTPDTKTVDGNSASNYFKKWVAEQKGSGADFTPAEVAKFTEPPKVHIANNPPSTSETTKGASASKGKKKDPSRYLNYLTQYHQDRENWKFNKAIQNDIIDNAFNVFRVPEEYSEALLEYIGGLQGAGVIERLRERCIKTIEEVDEAEKKDPMDEREAMKEAALQDRLSKERKRRRVEGDIENLKDHEYSEGFVRRLKRSRAEALCAVLKVPMPAPMRPSANAARPNAQSNTRKKKRRTDVSSDESSDSSDSSSSEEESEEEEKPGHVSSSEATSSDEDDSSDSASDTSSSDSSSSDDNSD